MLYQNVNFDEDIKDLIIIGDARANNREETEMKMKKAGWSEKPVFADEELLKLTKSKTKVHSFYIHGSVSNF